MSQDKKYTFLDYLNDEGSKLPDQQMHLIILFLHPEIQHHTAYH